MHACTPQQVFKIRPNGILEVEILGAPGIGV